MHKEKNIQPNQEKAYRNKKQIAIDGKIMAIISIVIIFSIGFGIYGIIQSTQKEGQIFNLNDQISKLQAKISLFEEKTNTSNEDAHNSGEEQANEVALRLGSGRYLEIPEWGVQFEYPDNIIEVTYDLRPKDDISGPLYTTIYFDCILYYPIASFSNTTGEISTTISDGINKYCATEDEMPGIQGASELGKLQRWDEAEAAQYKEKGVIVGNLLDINPGGETIFEQNSTQYILANLDSVVSAEHKLAWGQLRALLKNISYTQ